jgi:DNA-binding NarL/FixJ family response regulator
VDDLASFRRAATAVIDATDGFVVSGQAESGEAALELLDRVSVGLVVMDVQMPGMGGIRAAEEMLRRHPTVRVLLLSVHRYAELPSMAGRSGAAFCHKEQFGPDLLEQVWRSP